MLHMKNRLKPFGVYDDEAIKLIHKRAHREKRSFSNAASVTIIKALSGKNTTRKKVENQIKNESKDA